MSIKERVHVKCYADKAREARLRWFRHTQRKESQFISREMLRLELQAGGLKEDQREDSGGT